MVLVLKKKRFVALAALTAAFLLVAFSPYILSTSLALRFVLAAVNARIPGSLSIDSWLVGWQQGILCQQVVYTDAEHGLHLSIPRLTSTQGLLELAFTPKNLGLLVVDTPQLEIKNSAPTVVSGQTASAGDRETSGRTPFWNQLTADLEIRDGQATIALAEPALVTGIRNVSLSAALDSGVVTFTLTLHSLRDQGKLRATGSLNFPARKHGWLDTLLADVELSVNSLQLRELLTLAGQNSFLPAGEGVLNADLRFNAVGLEGLKVSGVVELGELKLRGGFLGEDSPSLQNMQVRLDDGRWAAAGWSIKQVALASDAADLEGSCQVNAAGLKLAGKGRVNLPVLFDQFPGLLHLRDSTLVESGALDFSVDLGVGGDGQHLDLKARADNLSGIADGRQFAWTGPVSVLANGVRTEKDLRVNALQIDAPFLAADGRGDLRSFVLDASADLHQAFADVGQLFRLEWDGGGQLDLVMKGMVDSENGQRLKVETDLQVNNFTLSRAGTLIIPSDEFSLLSSFSAPLSLGKERVGGLDLQFALSSWLGETFLTMTGEKLAGRPFRGYYSTDTSLDLDSATGLLHTLGILPGAATVAGEMQMQAAGYLSEDGLEVREFFGEIGSLSFVRAGASFADQQVRLEIQQSINEEIKAFTVHNLVVADNQEEFFRTGAGLNMVGFADYSLYLHNILLTSATGTIKLAELLVPDRRTPLAGLGVGLTGTVDLGQVAGLLHGVAWLPRETGLAGSGHFVMQAAATAQGGQELNTELRLDNFSLVRQNKKISVSDKVRLALRLSQQTPDADIDIKELRLDSAPLAVEGIGVITRSAERQVIELQGKLTPELEQVTAVLRDGFGLNVRLSGGQSEPFLAQYRLAGSDGENGAAGSLVASLHADRLEYQSITVRALHLPLSVEKGNLHLEITGQLYEGKLAVIADSDLAAEPVTIKVPEKSQVLTGVHMQKPLVDGLLSSIHPLFGVLAVPSGQLDLRLDSFTWPVQAGGDKAAFKTVVDLRDITLESTEVLREILTLFGLEKEKITLKDSELTCTGRQGRISCAPVRLRVAEADMLVSGSMGPDRTLDYLLEIPVTRKLVSEEGYRFLQGATIRVPIQGTVTKPVFDRTKVTAAIKDLMQQAAAKLLQEGKGKEQPGSGEEKSVPGQKM